MKTWLRSKIPPQLLWVALVVCAVALVEGGVALLGPRQSDDRNNFFEYRFGHTEIVDRVFITEKTRLLARDEATIIQVGDSSGFHGVIPPVVEAMIPGIRYANMNIFAGLGYTGFLEVARYMLDHSNKTKFIVLYVSPAGFQPNEWSLNESERIGGDIWREFNSPWQRLFHIPSLTLRREVTSAIYDWRVQSAAERNATSTAHYPEADRLIEQTGGWTRERDTPGDATKGAFQTLRSFFDPKQTDREVMLKGGAPYGLSPRVFDWRRLGRVNVAEQTFDKFRRLAEEHGARLIIASAPMYESARMDPIGAQLETWQQTLRDYHAKHPSVGIVPMVYYPDDYLASPVHVSTPHTLQNTIRFATALKDAIGAQSLAALTPREPVQRPVTHEIVMAADAPVYGFGDSERIGDVDYRAIRQGRYEGLIFARLPAGAKTVEMELAPDVPAAVRDGASISVLGALAERVSSSSDRRIVWRLPEGSRRYRGFVEILLSTRGLSAWPGDALHDGATGPELKISRISFGGGDLASRERGPAVGSE